jgi:uncharacterized protein YbcV (DUF1398 family)
MEKAIAERDKDLSEMQAGSAHIKQVNQDFFTMNEKLKQDLVHCQEHLQNLLKHNAFIQDEMENFVREDDAIISVIRRKRLFPIANANNFNSLRTSRNEGRSTNRTYK